MFNVFEGVAQTTKASQSPRFTIRSIHAYVVGYYMLGLKERDPALLYIVYKTDNSFSNITACLFVPWNLQIILTHCRLQ